MVAVSNSFPEDAVLYGTSGLKLRSSPPNAPPVQVRLPNGMIYPGRIDAAFDHAATQVIVRLRNRRQWCKIASARQYIGDMCRSYLQELGLSPAQQLQEIAMAGVVEIGIPAACGAPAYAFPWEFASSEATASLRRSQPLLVVRYLDRGPLGIHNARRALLVTSIP